MKLGKLSRVLSALLLLICSGTTVEAQKPPRTIRIFLEVKETNLDRPSTVAVNTLSERLKAAGFHLAANRREANVIVEGAISSRPSAVTDDVQRQGGVNAEATASVRLLAGGEVIATSVQRSAPGDWGVQAERIGEDRLIEVAGRVAEDLLDGNFVDEVIGPDKKAASEATKPSHSSATRKRSAPKRGVSFLEVVSLVQNSVPDDRIASAVQKYGIKFKPRESALAQLRGAGASETVINAVKSSSVTS